MNSEMKLLVQKAMAGNTAALALVCERESASVKHLCIHLMGNLHDGEDAAQEVMLKLQTGIAGLKDAQAFPLWLHRIVANTCRDMKRAEARRKTRLHADAGEDTPEINPAYLPVDTAEQREAERAVTKALGRLPYHYKEALVLHYYQELTLEQIAGVTGTNPRAVRNRLYQARKALRRQLEKQYGKKASLPAAIMAGPLGAALAAAGGTGGPMAALGAIAEGAALLVAKLSLATGASVTALTATTGAVVVVATTGVIIGSTALSPGAKPVVESPVPQQGAHHEGEQGLYIASALEDNVDGTYVPGNSAGPAGQDDGLAAPHGEDQGPADGGSFAASARQDAGSATNGPESKNHTTTSTPAVGPPQAGEGGGAPAAETVQYMGTFQFTKGNSTALAQYNSLAEGFQLSVYSGDILVAFATADATGGFTLEVPPTATWPLHVEVEALYGFGPAAGQGSFAFAIPQNSGELLAPIEFTSILAPGATIVYTGQNGERQNSKRNPATASITPYASTTATASWWVADENGTTVLQDEGFTVSLTALQNSPGSYTLHCTITDAAGNTGTMAREFAVSN